MAGGDGRILDPGIRLVLEEIRDLRREMRDDRRRADIAAIAERRRAAADGRRAAEDRRQAAEDRRQAAEDRRQATEDRRQATQDRRRSDARFEQVIAEFRRDSARRDAATQKMIETTQAAFRDIRSVGLSIVKTLNRHTRLLERIDRKLGVRGNGGLGQADGRTS